MDVGEPERQKTEEAGTPGVRGHCERRRTKRLKFFSGVHNPKERGSNNESGKRSRGGEKYYIISSRIQSQESPEDFNEFSSLKLTQMSYV